MSESLQEILERAADYQRRFPLCHHLIEHEGRVFERVQHRTGFRIPGQLLIDPARYTPTRLEATYVRWGDRLEDHWERKILPLIARLQVHGPAYAPSPHGKGYYWLYEAGTLGDRKPGYGHTGVPEDEVPAGALTAECLALGIEMQRHDLWRTQVGRRKDLLAMALVECVGATLHLSGSTIREFLEINGRIYEAISTDGWTWGLTRQESVPTVRVL